MSKEKRTKLNKLGFDLAPLETQRKELLNRLEIFIKQNGHSRVTRDYKDADGYPLGAKVKTLRNKRTIKTLTKEFKLQLESLGFVFNLYDRTEIPTGRPKSKT